MHVHATSSGTLHMFLTPSTANLPMMSSHTPEDKQPVRGTLEGVDRAQTQAADLVTVQLQHGQPVTLKQNPTALKGSNVRVGACAWDGAYVLSAYLDAQPPGTFAGALFATQWRPYSVLGSPQQLQSNSSNR
jgi:hypothetical protein